MRNRAFRPTATILIFILCASVNTYAAPVALTDVIQVLTNNQNPPDLRLRNISQDPVLQGSVVYDRLQPLLRGDRPSTGESDSLFAGLAIGQDPQKIDVIAGDDVEGTVCDCGDIVVPGGGWPKWPLLLLGTIPFFFIDHDCDQCDSSTPTPTPPQPIPTPTPTPEPGSLLLLGTGLAAFGAAMRRRYSQSRIVARIRSKEEA